MVHSLIGDSSFVIFYEYASLCIFIACTVTASIIYQYIYSKQKVEIVGNSINLYSFSEYLYDLIIKVWSLISVRDKTKLIKLIKAENSSPYENAKKYRNCYIKSNYVISRNCPFLNVLVTSSQKNLFYIYMEYVYARPIPNSADIAFLTQIIDSANFSYKIEILRQRICKWSYRNPKYKYKNPYAVKFYLRFTGNLRRVTPDVSSTRTPFAA